MKRITKADFISALKLCALGLLVGALGGVVGAAFSHLLALVTRTRLENAWLILLLPIGGIVTVVLYRVLHMSDYGGANEIIDCVHDNRPTRAIAAPLIFVSTAITHFLGGSAGREGAALQLGGAGASAIARLFRLKDSERSALVLSGMSAVFAGVFGTPLTAGFFVLEFKSGKRNFLLAVLPCFISALGASQVASLMGVADESMHIGSVAAPEFMTIAKIIALSVGLSLLGILMCFVFHRAERISKKLVRNPFLRIVIGAAAIIAMTAAVGDMRYNGAGMEMAHAAIEGSADWFDFALKMAFTAVTLAAGFKGGEIVPTFCIGATFGCVLGGALGLDVGLAAALGLVGLFCSVTNSLVSAIFLSVEMFGISAVPYFVIVCVIAWLLSPSDSLFRNRFFNSPIFAKIKKQ